MAAAQYWQENTFWMQVELSQEMINLKQAEAEKRRSAVQKNSFGQNYMKPSLAFAVHYHLLSVYDPESKKCSRIKRSKDAKYPERWSRLHGDYFSHTLESFTV